MQGTGSSRKRWICMSCGGGECAGKQGKSVNGESGSRYGSLKKRGDLRFNEFVDFVNIYRGLERNESAALCSEGTTR